MICKQDLDPTSKMKYWQALVAFRKSKIADGLECSVLSYTDIQECIDVVNHQYDENNMCKFWKKLFPCILKSDKHNFSLFKWYSNLFIKLLLMSILDWLLVSKIKCVVIFSDIGLTWFKHCSRRQRPESHVKGFTKSWIQSCGIYFFHWCCVVLQTFACTYQTFSHPF